MLCNFSVEMWKQWPLEEQTMLKDQTFIKQVKWLLKEWSLNGTNLIPMVSTQFMRRQWTSVATLCAFFMVGLQNGCAFPTSDFRSCSFMNHFLLISYVQSKKSKSGFLSDRMIFFVFGLKLVSLFIFRIFNFETVSSIRQYSQSLINPYIKI